jgi:thiol:disulfide interchange protein
MKRIFIMLGVVFAVIICAFYLPHYRAVALVNLLMVTGGLWFTTSFLKQVDSGR